MTKKATLGELATQYPLSTKIFHHYGLDYCCGGKDNLEDACREKQLSPDQVLAEIAKEDASEDRRIQWNERPVGELIDYILTRYHAPLREEIPRLIALAAKVEQVHADKKDCPKGLHRHLVAINDAVEGHLAKEEQILFPMIQTGQMHGACNPIRVMMLEHEEHGENLRKTRDITRNFFLPGEACSSWRELYRGLEQLEKDLMDHIHLENNILFPRVAAA